MSEKQTNIITKEKLKKYFHVTETAFKMAKESANRTDMKKEREDFINMIQCYINDANHFESNEDWVNAFAALNYAHGWLDSGARLGIFDVHDDVLFTVDGKK